MDLSGGYGARSNGLESLHITDEFRQLVTQENAGSFTALLELPATQAVELLHQPLCGTFESHTGLMERAARYSVVANENGETTTPTSSMSANPERVKTEPSETHSPCPSQNKGKRKEFDKKGKSSSKKNKSCEENEKLPYVHVRARRGQATDSHSLAERARREKINARMKLLQELVPGCDKIQGTALVLDGIINHVQSLQRQVEMLSMRLAAVNPRIDFNLDNILASENGSLMDGSFNGTPMQLAWPHQVIETEQSYHQRQLQQPPPQLPQQWPLDGLNQPVWGREEDQTHGNDNNNLMGVSENLMVGSANLHPNQVKTEL